MSTRIWHRTALGNVDTDGLCVQQVRLKTSRTSPRLSSSSSIKHALYKLAMHGMLNVRAIAQPFTASWLLPRLGFGGSATVIALAPSCQQPDTI